VLMVGGSSKLRGLYDHIEDRFDCEIIEPDSTADWHVAHGACLLNKIRGQYQLSQNVGLLLSDDSYFPLLKKYQAVTHKQHVQSFGLVEDSQTANFVFVESSKGIHRTLGYISVPSYGFLFEPVELHYRINKDLLLEVSAKSGNMGSDGIEKWEYAGLRFSYTLPV
jgi:molecular chaperone DnaK